jgi:hypothetical protein
MQDKMLNSFQSRSAHSRSSIDGSERDGESLASLADTNAKNSTMGRGGSDAFIAPEDNAQTWQSPKPRTIEADPK